MATTNIEIARYAAQAPGWRAKRSMDVVLSLAGLVALFPVFLVIAIAIAGTSRGAVLFVQERVGLNGKTFKMFKFRSMYSDADARRGREMHLL